MNIILFDDPSIRLDLLPFTFTRPVGDIRVGILTIAEKWKRLTGDEVSFQTESYLSAKYPSKKSNDNYFINGAICPDEAVLNAVKNLKSGEGLSTGETLLAARSSEESVPALNSIKCANYSAAILVDQLWRIFQLNGYQIRSDYKLITTGRNSIGLEDVHTCSYNTADIFVEEGVVIRAAILNAEHGPIYLGKNSQIHEGAIIRGPFALGENSHVNMGAKVRGDTSVGPFSKIGGEVSNSVIFGYSNKAHDGFLGNSVIGEWCNLGADTNTSNLKNNFENIKLWNYQKKGFKDSGLTFCGLMLGDHSKCGINTMFNTGTVVGVSASIFGDGYPRTFIPSFAWGGAAGFTTFRLDKALDTARKAMSRRDVDLGEIDTKIMEEVFKQTADYRAWERASSAFV
jgi:UDP-N-acetylglucosamine diphosphorylase/glucosamine-1-phosphate N-acetyltransferase